MPPATGSLFDDELPPGFHYQRDFVTRDEEASLVSRIARVPFASFEMRGVVARRRVAFFGRSYDAGSMPTAPMPDFLLPIRDRLAAWCDVDAHAFEMALINEYPPGAPIGWHRDAPQYEDVAGLSLVSACRMKFRPYLPPAGRRSPGLPKRTATHEIALEPRSAYLMTGESRQRFEHHIPAVTSLRYSVTFRTLRH